MRRRGGTYRGQRVYDSVYQISKQSGKTVIKKDRRTLFCDFFYFFEKILSRARVFCCQLQEKVLK